MGQVTKHGVVEFKLLHVQSLQTSEMERVTKQLLPFLIVDEGPQSWTLFGDDVRDQTLQLFRVFAPN